MDLRTLALEQQCKLLRWRPASCRHIWREVGGSLVCTVTYAQTRVEVAELCITDATLHSFGLRIEVATGEVTSSPPL